MNPATAFIAEIDRRELILRIIEAQAEHKRPEGMTIDEALETSHPGMVKMAGRAADAVMEYIAECLNAARPLQ